MSDYTTQHPGALPPDVEAYRSTNVFSEETLPAGLRKNHSTKAGVWAVIHVEEGRLRYCVPAWNYDKILEAGQQDIVAPQVVHYVEPQGKVRMFVVFHSLPDQAPGDPHSLR